MVALPEIGPLPPMPQIATRVIGLSNDESSTAQDLARVVSSDQALTARVLKIANSASYRGRHPIVSLGQAIPRIGFAALRDLAVAEAVKGVAMAKGPNAERAERVWQHSLKSAAFAKEVARVLRLNVEAAFLCGLLQSIGKSIILRFVEADVDAVLAEHHHALGVAFVAENDLPEVISACIRRDRDAGDEMIDVCAVADVLAAGLVDRDFAAARQHPALQSLNMYPDDLERVIARAEEIESLVQVMA